MSLNTSDHWEHFSLYHGWKPGNPSQCKICMQLELKATKKSIEDHAQDQMGRPW